MVAFAAQTFGRETEGIFRPQVRGGRVDLGEQKVLDVEGEP
jgi:hypothetical protein